jgi:sodium/bile acid cotransporter 7
MVWMALCASREAIVAGFGSILPIIGVVFLFHLALVLTALFVTRIGGINKGRRESIVFMGGQKTLPLSIILQVTLFPEFGIALVVCVMHHIIHLIMDAILIQYMKNME